jgi:hypothetical protein
MISRGPDDLYCNDHLVVGIRYAKPKEPWIVRNMEALGFPNRAYDLVGNDPIPNELDALELGVHVESEFVMQQLAADGAWWNDLGTYLTGLLDEEV